MGQTLTHGVYLPDEGERNCYSGLAANWQILDGSVGTIAAHTAALAGKAPLVHTHTKSDITDFPAYGNAAGTICEGNDSRLSDARTPVAHTHGKADITDLFNSANTWSGDNTFSKTVGFTKVNATTLYAQNARVELGDSGLSGDSYNQISFWDKNGDNVSYLRQTYNTDGTNTLNIFVRNKFLNGVPNTAGTVDYAYFGIILGADKSKQAVFKANLRPYDNTYNYNLGDSTYQWNNLYAKNYYYNGTAWGLDKANTWSGVNTFSGATNCILNFKFGTSGSYNDIRWKDNNDSNYATLRSKANTILLCLRYSSASNWYDGSSININNDGTAQIKAYDGTETWTVNFTPVGVYPTSNNALELGTSTNKWKTLNGINPGALSIPNKDNKVDITSEFTDLTGGGIFYIPPSDGWINITADNEIYCAVVSTTHKTTFWCQSASATSMSKAAVTIPVKYTQHFLAKIKSTDAITVTFYPCLGNV